jgi:DNA uptake protein ComE-like DNA-binding protein
MAGRHWLDPLARRLLVATGQLPPMATGPLPPPGTGPWPPPAAGEVDETVERELLALKLSQNPSLRLRNGAEVRHAAALGWCLEVNRAGAADWLRLPGCRPDQVDRLSRLQADGLRLHAPADLAEAMEVPLEQVGLWRPVLSFRRCGEPAAALKPPSLAINHAPEPLLRERLGLGPERCRRLLRERAREPFRDLADLQERLDLPAALIERWIGRIRFAPPAPGPVLPPARRPSR